MSVMRWRWRRRRSLVCRDAVALMAAYLDGSLSAADRERLHTHLAECPHCSEYLSQLQTTIEALGRADPAALSDEALDELVELYRRWRSSSV